MFYVEQPMKCLFFAIIALFLTSCTQADRNPELRDEIYKDLVIELEIAEKAFEAEEKLHERLTVDLGKALPQTGQVKYATKKLRDSSDRLNTLSQQKTYFGIKIEQRKAYVQSRYQESLKDPNKPWPDEKELELYRSVVKFNREKIAWDKTKGMKKNVPRGTGEVKADAGK
jgi:hypothetical protein